MLNKSIKKCGHFSSHFQLSFTKPFCNHLDARCEIALAHEPGGFRVYIRNDWNCVLRVVRDRVAVFDRARAVDLTARFGAAIARGCIPQMTADPA